MSRRGPVPTATPQRIPFLIRTETQELLMDSQDVYPRRLGQDGSKAMNLRSVDGTMMTAGHSHGAPSCWQLTGRLDIRPTGTAEAAEATEHDLGTFGAGTRKQTVLLGKQWLASPSCSRAVLSPHIHGCGSFSLGLAERWTAGHEDDHLGGRSIIV